MPRAPEETAVPEAPVTDIPRLLRIQASAQSLLDELHQLRDPADRSAAKRLVRLDRALTEDLEQILDDELRRELHACIQELPLTDTSTDQIRVALAQLEGWVTGLLGGLSLIVSAPPPGQPEAPPNRPSVSAA